MISYSRPKLSDLYTLPALIYIPYPRVNCLKTIPFTAANTYIAHIWQYPPPRAKATQKPYPLGRHIQMAYIRDYPRGILYIKSVWPVYSGIDLSIQSYTKFFFTKVFDLPSLSPL